MRASIRARQHRRPRSSSPRPTGWGESTTQVVPIAAVVNGSGRRPLPRTSMRASDPNSTPVANAGPDRTINDTDGQPGEDVSCSTPPLRPTIRAPSSPISGSTSTTTWRSAPQSTTPTLPRSPSARAPTTSRYKCHRRLRRRRVGFATTTVVITVSAPAIPTANAGPDRNIPDSDGEPGESVTLDGSASTDTDGTIASFTWSRQISVERDRAARHGPDADREAARRRQRHPPCRDRQRRHPVRRYSHDHCRHGAAGCRALRNPEPHAERTPDGEQARRHVRRAGGARERRGAADRGSGRPVGEVQRAAQRRPTRLRTRSTRSKS